MLIVRTPFRISFFGGGTDVKEYYSEHGGAVLSTTFDKYCYVVMRYNPPFFDYKGRLNYSKIEKFNRAEEIEHPMVREALKKYGFSDVHITYDADLPARSGLGTSSAFSVGLLNGIHAMRGEMVDKMTLAEEAIDLERVRCREAGGVQDQLACSFGGLNRMKFGNTGGGEIDVSPIPLLRERKERFCEQLLLFFTGFSRNSSTILAKQIANTKNKLAELGEMAALVDEGINALSRDDDFREFGRLLDHTWRLKRTLASGISNDDIDRIYDRARNAGALGGKILGGGGGGFLLFIVEPGAQQSVIDALNDLLHVPFKFEDEGTKIIYFQSEKRLRR